MKPDFYTILKSFFMSEIFILSCSMNRIDIKNYLEKIYNVNVHRVDTRIQLGTFYHLILYKFLNLIFA